MTISLNQKYWKTYQKINHKNEKNYKCRKIEKQASLSNSLPTPSAGFLKHRDKPKRRSYYATIDSESDFEGLDGYRYKKPAMHPSTGYFGKRYFFLNLMLLL